MWQRFTERARKVVFYAQEEAQKFGEGYVSTEHLLLGLCREEDSTAAQILDVLGVSLDRIRGEVEKQLPREDARPSQDMTLTPRAKRVIDLSYDEARRLNDNYIGTEHILLGLIREGEGLAGRVLEKLGVELERTKAITLEIQAVNSEGRTKEAANPPRKPDLVFIPELNRAAHLMCKLTSRAWAIAEATEENVVTSEHFLRALSVEESGLAAKILAKYGLTSEVINEEIDRLRREA